MERESLPIAPEAGPVLLCAGERDLRLALGGLLRAAGRNVRTAADLGEAASGVISGPPACLLVVLPLPRSEASEVLSSLRGLSGGKRAPAVVIAPPEQAGRLEGFRSGEDVWLSPTASPEEIVEAVGRLVAASA